MFMRGTKSKGQALVIVLLVLSALLAAGIIYVRSIIAERTMANLYIQKEKAFYIAEAGLEDGKSTIAANPNWFTDNPHSPNDDINWLMNAATGSIKQFGGGSYKIVRESGKDIIYSVGQYKSGKSIVRVKYTPIPFKSYEFRIL